MDLNADGEVKKEEFLKFCRKDEAMAKLFDKKGEGGHALFFGLWLENGNHSHDLFLQIVLFYIEE